jgi:hypothetical protein
LQLCDNINNFIAAIQIKSIIVSWNYQDLWSELMAKKPMIRIHDVESDKITDREMTDAEFVEYQAEIAAIEALFQKNNES